MSKQIMPKSLEGFDLQKVKFLDDNKGVYVEALIHHVRDDQPCTDEFKYTKKAVPHADLVELKNRLRDPLLKAYNIHKGFDKALSYVPPSKKEIIEKAMFETFANVLVTTLSISGSDELRGAVVSGKNKSFNNAMAAMNTPRIVFSSDKLGFESEVEVISDEITREVFEFIVNDKRAHQSLFDGVEGHEVADPEEVTA